MFDDDGGSEETETQAGSVDPIAVATAAAGHFEHHPLFPRDDGSPETRDIQFVSFCRKRTGDQMRQNCPEDIPAHEVKSWAQVVEWWGGGEYKAIAKDRKHRMVAWFPSSGGEWLVFDGDSKPFTLRNGKPYRAPALNVAHPSADAPPPAPAPTPVVQDRLLGVMTEVLQELRNPRVAPAPAAPPNDGALVAMIQAQSQSNAQIVQTLLSTFAQRPSEPAARPAEPTTLALQLIGAVQKLVPAPVAPPGLAEQIPVIKALRELYQPAAVAPANELQPFVDIFGQVMAADAASKQAEAARAQTTSKPHEPPAPRPPPRPRPELVHVPGLGMVEVVAPDAGARRFDLLTDAARRFDLLTDEERATAIRRFHRDPALLAELGFGLPPSGGAPVSPAAPAQPVPASPASPVAPAVVASAPAMPAVPDLEPTPVSVVEATPPVASSAMAPARSVVATAPPEPATVTATSPVAPAPPAVPSVAAIASSVAPATPAAPAVVATSDELPPGAPEEERPPIALPERMPVVEPPHGSEPERERAMGELKRLTSLPHAQRVAVLRKLPGIGPMADDVAHAIGSLPPDALMAMAQSLDVDAIGVLAGRSNGAAGG
jgi:hypothetical protein